MKNTLVLFIILFNIFNSFSQTQEQMLDKMFEIANNKSDQEGAKNIALDLINSKYGAIDNETNFYAQYVISDFYYSKRKFKLASHYFNKLLQFSEDKNIKVEGIRQFLKDIKLKIQDSKIFLLEDNSTEEAVVAEIKKNTNHGKPSDHEKNQIVTINTNSKIDSNLANHTPSTSVNTSKTNDDKTETLTVIETEKTLEEVKTTDSNFVKIGNHF